MPTPPSYFVPRPESSLDAGIRRVLNGEVSTSPIAFDEMSADQLNKVVANAALSNQDRHSEAVSKADSYSFQVAHPEFIRTTANTKLVNYQLQTWGITNPTYPDLVRAYEILRDSHLLDIDKAALARQEPRSFTGTLTKQTFYTVDEMISAERQAAIQQVPEPSEEEIAFENLPNSQVLPMLKRLEHKAHHQGDALETGSNADAWLTLHPEFIDSIHNGKLMRLQLATNGVLEDVASIADYETAYQQLRASDLLSLNQKALAKQHREELQQRASDAIAEGGTVFDKTSEAEMYEMDLETVRKRANAVMGR